MKNNVTRLLFIILLVIVALYIYVYSTGGNFKYVFFAPRNSVNFTSTPSVIQKEAGNPIEVIAENLNIPWEIAVLPGGDLLVTERSGQLLKIGAETKIISKIAGIKHIGEGGLLGLALHPDFSNNHYIYLYSTTQDSRGISNRVERYLFSDDTLTGRRIILENIQGSSNHDGGRIAFGPDGYLYITTGDAEKRESAQDKNSLNGKILRVADDGGIPSDNPFGNAVYSFGHRNPQGLAWDSKGTLWVSEHGPSGPQTGYDEINRIVKGGNYGWPVIKGDEKKEGMIAPVIHSGSEDTWAPSGMAYNNGSLFFSGLRGETLYQGSIGSDDSMSLHTHLSREYGRLRAVVASSDGYLYVSTSNTDGRGKPKSGDDKIIKINLTKYSL